MSPMLFLTESDVRQLLPMPEAIRLMREAFERLAKGEAINQPRRRLVLPTGSVLHYMAAGDGKYFGTKIYSTNPAHGAHFLFLLYRASDGQPLALVQANHLGQIRTGAVSGLATQLMARPDAATVGVIGAGFQARSQLEAVLHAWPVKSVRVWSRSAERRVPFAAECSKTFQVPVVAADTAEQAVRGAQIVITATNARDPVLEAGWLEPGTHINAMGSNHPKRRELPAEVVRKADWIVVDSREQARTESGDLLLALDEEGWEKTVELQEVVAHGLARPHADSLTLFKSNGLAVEDVIAAGFVFERALEAGLGRPVDPLYS